MAYQSISHSRSHRVPFHGLGRAPGYMGNYCSDGMAGPSPGDPDFVKSLLGGGGGASKAGGGGDSAAAIAGAVSSVANTIGTGIDAAMGGPQKRERESKRNYEIAKLQAQAAAGNADAAIQVARLQAEASVEAARLAAQGSGMDKKTTVIIAAVGGVALLGVLGVFLLKK